MIPVISLIGRSNVGKSSLFNLLTQSRQSLVDKSEKTTRDRNYGYFTIKNTNFCIIDTAGIENFKNKKNIDLIQKESYQQTKKSIKESNFIIFIVDIYTGITKLDYLILKKLRKKNKKILLLINKIDFLKRKDNIIDFYEFGIKDFCLISILHRIGINKTLKKIIYIWNKIKKKEKIKDVKLNEKKNIICKINICLIGKPNVGKSSIINFVSKKNRMITSNIPGTTRDIIKITVKKKNIEYIFTDTAGIKKKNNTKLEKVSYIKLIQEIKKNNIIIMIIDASTGICSQDLSIIGNLIKKGCSFFILVNKWDLIKKNNKKKIQSIMNFRLKFIKNIKILYVSALYKEGFKNLFSYILIVYKETIQEFNPSYLTNIIKKAILQHPIPLGATGKVIRLKYAHLGGKKPIFIIIHGNNTNYIPQTYKKYLMHFLQKELQIPNTPIRLFFKNGDNPYYNNKKKIN
ncbi:ribosome biogenesis GTPase Der [Buchnera aphidicola]|uniref:GTPase Der n=1 Tax=Buchnera aphidicola (Cinara strobi) TaxID=1921549 RepID=A0A3B1DMP8_9GAMM|nr:ribosome biogenesis GTPase Der [Buchnera aphidicola]VAX76921.1 GTPase Der [Buchnera aphidicola (Cinara strobi)]